MRRTVAIYCVLICAGASNGVNDKVDNSDKNGRLYDKAGKMRKIRHEQKESDGEG